MRHDRLRLLGAASLAVAGLCGALALGGRSIVERADFAFCNQQELQSLDPAVITGVPESRILQALYEGLVRADPATGEPLPGMAESWSVSDDGLTWTFRMRAGSRWTNGDPVTAGDFAYSFRRLLEPATAAPYADTLWCLRGARELSSGEAAVAGPDGASPPLGVRAPDDGTLVLELLQPTPHLPALLAMAPLLPVNRRCVEAWGPDWIRPEHIVTNGPFRLVERRVRDRLRLERHEGYWGREQVALRSIDAYAAEGITTQLNMYLTGQVDWMIKPPTSLYASVLPRPDAIRGPQAGTTFMRFNTTRAPFDDPQVRRALALALDREALARDVMRGGELACTSFVPAGLGAYVPAPLAPADLAGARELLTRAGYPDGRGFPEFELLYPHNESTRDFCEAVAAQWRDRLGLRPRLVNQAWKVYLDSCKQLEYDVAWGAWQADYADATSFLDCFKSGVGNNRTGWASASYDALLAQAALQPQEAPRMALLAQAEALLLDELPIAPVYQRICLNLVAGRVRGFHDNVLDLHPLRDLSVSP